MTTQTSPLPTKRHLSRTRRQLLIGALGLGLVAYLLGQMGFRIEMPAPSRSAADAKMAAEIEAAGGRVTSLGFSEGTLGFGRQERMQAAFQKGELDDAGLKKIADVATDHLTDLILYDARLSDDGVKSLAKLRGLRKLVLSSNMSLPHDARKFQVTDASLASLSDVDGLEMLILEGTDVSGTGFDHLKGWKRLQFLSLSYSRVTDEGLKHLADAIPSLATLELNQTGITDEGVKHLARMKVKFLSLSYNPGLTAPGLKELAAMDGLETLTLLGSPLTAADLAELREARPFLHIDFGPSSLPKPRKPRP